MPRYETKSDDRRGSTPYSYKERKSRHHESQSNGSHHYRVKDNCSRDRVRHRGDYKDKSTRSYRRNDNNKEYSHSRNHKFDRRQCHGGIEKREIHRSRSRSKDRSHDKVRSRSSSPLLPKSKRTSGFDMAPPVAASFSSGTEQILGSSKAHPSISGMLQNVFPTDATKVNPLGAFPFLPFQAMSQQATRHARRVYVGGLPPLANEQTISAFFSHVMIVVGGNSAGPGDAVVNVYINHEKKFAFVELRTVEEASNAMALDGVVFEGVPLRIRRPTDYNPSLAAALGPGHPSPHLNLTAAGLMPGATGDAEEPDRIFVGGLPYLFTEMQIKQLLESFGPLRKFEVVKDRDTGNSKGYGFCTYQDPLATDVACASLNGLRMGDKTLTVRRAASNSGQVKYEQEIVLAQARQHIAMQKMAFEASGLTIPGTEIGPVVTAEIPTKVLCLTEVITPQELFDDVEYGEILEDMKEEGQKFGDLIDVIIPRPEDQNMKGLGKYSIEQWNLYNFAAMESPWSLPGCHWEHKVFLEYSDTLGCTKAKAALGGRKFGGNTIVAIYYPEDKYYKKDYAS